MKLHAAEINNFRSIEHVSLETFGGLNVFIGKNNAGKSNLLTMLHTFFRCLTAGNVVALNPPFGKEMDFFDTRPHKPIEITLVFSLTEQERDELVEDIVQCAPQVKHAADRLDPTLRLMVTLAINPLPEPVGLFKEVSLGSNLTVNQGSDNSKHTLLSVPEAAATELQKRHADSEARMGQANELTQNMRYFDPDDWQAYREGRRTFRYPIRGRMMSRATDENVDALLRRSENYQEFRKSIDDFIATTQQQAKTALDQPLQNKLMTFAGNEESVPPYITNLLQRLAKFKVLYLRERRAPIGKDEAQRLLSLKMRRRGPEVLRNIQETVTALLGVQIDAFSPSEGDENAAEMDVDNFLVEANGSGIREALRLILDVELEHPQVLLVEEPEMHLHPALETSMMHYLKRISADLQVFISTHSTNFLDTADMQNVFLVSKARSTTVKLVNFEEAAVNIPRELGMRLSTFFMFDRLVFIEGPSDEAILREWASVLGINLTHANVGFIPIGGARNFTHFASQSTLSFLTKRQVSMWFLIDRDERSEPDIANLEKILGENAKLHVLEKREIENYLLCPRVITELIKSKSKTTARVQDKPTEAEIAAILNDSADELKQVTINKRTARILCGPIFPSRDMSEAVLRPNLITDAIIADIDKQINQLEQTKNAAENAYQEQIKKVENIWNTHKLAIVPGDLLLDRVFQNYKLRFRKDKDGATLASLMTRDEIGTEIRELIRDITASQGSE